MLSPVKTLDRFMLKSFLPLFAMTFFICTFIVLMQFLWMHINDMVGKGLGVGLLSELFFYAALSMVPLSLPLAVLLASLMTFGNLGESLELTAMKSGGISLFRVMKPLIILMSIVSIGAFFFQNNVLPVTQSRMWTLLKSMRQKNPELDIVRGEFNNQMPGINIYVEDKNNSTGVLYRVMIYDMRSGFERSRVILADSATLSMEDNRSYMRLELFAGELFENLRDATGDLNNARDQLYRREMFTHKLLRVPFDANFEMMDENDMRSLYIGQNVSQLRHSIDSINRRLDSISSSFGREVAAQKFMRKSAADFPAADLSPTVKPTQSMPVDSMFHAQTIDARRRYIEEAQASLAQQKMEYFGRSLYIEDESKVLRRHGIEMHKKFTLSLACLVFFFIGAPLGSIIRKGGLGTSLVISVLLFIFYYIVDNSGMKMARDGQVKVWAGMWQSSAILLPLGVWVTWKAVHDSTLFNADSWQRTMRMLTGRYVRALSVKEVIIEDMNLAHAQQLLTQTEADCRAFLARYPHPQGYMAYWHGGISKEALLALIANVEITVSYLSNVRQKSLIDLLNRVPVIQSVKLLHLHSKWLPWCLPLGLPIYLLSLLFQLRILKSVKQTLRLLPQIAEMLDTQHTPTQCHKP